MNYAQFLNQSKETWLLADGGGGTKLGAGCARQTPGMPMILSLSPGGRPYMDSYWYLTLGSRPVQEVVYDLYFKFNSVADYQASQAIEFEFRDDSISEEEDGGWQALFSIGLWRIYDFKDQRWIQTGIKLPTQAEWVAGVNVGAVYSVAEGQSTQDGILFRGLLVNGVWQPVGGLEVAVHTTTSPKFNMAVQLDGNGRGDAYSVEVLADMRIL